MDKEKELKMEEAIIEVRKIRALAQLMLASQMDEWVADTGLVIYDLACKANEFLEQACTQAKDQE